MRADERPTLANWMEPPGNRWAFRHVREILPTERVAAVGVPRPFETESADGLLELGYRSRDASEWTVRAMLERTYGDAFLALHAGRIALEWYAPGVAPDNRHILFSVTKSVTGLLAGVLSDEGALDLDGPVTDLVPEARDSAFGDASVRHLLDMSVAMRFEEDYSPGPDVLRYLTRHCGFTRCSAGHRPRAGRTARPRPSAGGSVPRAASGVGGRRAGWSSRHRRRRR